MIGLSSSIYVDTYGPRSITAKEYNGACGAPVFTRQIHGNCYDTSSPRQAQAVETLEVDGEVITDSHAKASLLISTFLPSLPPVSISHHHIVDSTWAKARPPGRCVVAPVSTKELKWACFRMRSSAAPGADMLPIVILQRCFREICQLFKKFIHRLSRVRIFSPPLERS